MATGTPTTNSHSGKHRLDPEIEKYRLELNWTKILDKLKSAKVSEVSRNDLIRVENRRKSGGSIRSFEGQCLLAKLYYNLNKLSRKF
ncbi:unnamed protein product [Rotaria sordida]|uniref:Uncharacterized protein n=1 Tax=Rotaria sordida TaxID=392033 RepID=A0A820FPG0_9BILA|nr:unnamed protein product [Rotaria sordida]CAF4209492.1 unnamed protein product [Rotaria sordida]CAF4264908.1 unnamed protein product [Rotaria sordida]